MFIVEDLCFNEPGYASGEQAVWQATKAIRVTCMVPAKTLLVSLSINFRGVAWISEVTGISLFVTIPQCSCGFWSWVLGIVTAITFARAQSLSYGQLLSLAAPLPGLLSFHQYPSKRKVKGFILDIPAFLSELLCFITTGKEKNGRSRRNSTETTSTG
jgi:hypothetical protein